MNAPKCAAIRQFIANGAELYPGWIPEVSGADYGKPRGPRSHRCRLDDEGDPRLVTWPSGLNAAGINFLIDFTGGRLRRRGLVGARAAPKMDNKVTAELLDGRKSARDDLAMAVLSRVIPLFWFSTKPHHPSQGIGGGRCGVGNAATTNPQ